MAGVINIMANIISHAFKLGELFVASQHVLVPYLNKHSPLTHNESWTQYHVLKYQVSCVIACLHENLQPVASLLRQTPSARNTGITVKNTLQPQASTHSLTSQFLPTNMTLSQEHFLLGSGKEATDEEIISCVIACYFAHNM